MKNSLTQNQTGVAVEADFFDCLERVLGEIPREDLPGVHQVVEEAEEPGEVVELFEVTFGVSAWALLQKLSDAEQRVGDSEEPPGFPDTQKNSL